MKIISALFFVLALSILQTNAQTKGCLYALNCTPQLAEVAMEVILLLEKKLNLLQTSITALTVLAQNHASFVDMV